jgi:Nif-specific regulatory protein
LYERLDVFPIHVPPLRQRGKADVRLLATAFVEKLSRKTGKRIIRIDTLATDMLAAYPWPGNLRELENVIERAARMAEGDVIHWYHLPPSLQAPLLDENRHGRDIKIGGSAPFPIKANPRKSPQDLDAILMPPHAIRTPP